MGLQVHSIEVPQTGPFDQPECGRHWYQWIQVKIERLPSILEDLEKLTSRGLMEHSGTLSFRYALDKPFENL